MWVRTVRGELRDQLVLELGAPRHLIRSPIVDLGQEAGLVWGRAFYVDAMKVEANAAIPISRC